MLDMEKLWLDFNKFTKPDILSGYLAGGGDINLLHPNTGWSLLNLAIENRNSPFIKALSVSGININAPANNLPLFHAIDIDIDSAIQQDTEIDFSITFLLIELCADTKMKDINNKSVIDAISTYGDAVIKSFYQEIARRNLENML